MVTNEMLYSFNFSIAYINDIEEGNLLFILFSKLALFCKMSIFFLINAFDFNIIESFIVLKSRVKIDFFRYFLNNWKMFC